MPPEPLSYRATGIDPAWSLVIDDRLTFTAADSEPVTEPTPPMIRGLVRGEAELYLTRRIEVNIARDQCHPRNPSAPDKVEVTVDGHSYEGCGGVAG